MLTIVRTFALMKMGKRGVTALEYAIIAGVLGAILVAAFGSFGTQLKTAMTSVGNSI